MDVLQPVWPDHFPQQLRSALPLLVVRRPLRDPIPTSMEDFIILWKKKLTQTELRASFSDSVCGAMAGLTEKGEQVFERCTPLIPAKLLPMLPRLSRDSKSKLLRILIRWYARVQVDARTKGATLNLAVHLLDMSLHNFMRDSHKIVMTDPGGIGVVARRPHSDLPESALQKLLLPCAIDSTSRPPELDASGDTLVCASSSEFAILSHLCQVFSCLPNPLDVVQFFDGPIPPQFWQTAMDVDFDVAEIFSAFLVRDTTLRPSVKTTVNLAAGTTGSLLAATAMQALEYGLFMSHTAENEFWEAYHRRHDEYVPTYQKVAAETPSLTSKESQVAGLNRTIHVWNPPELQALSENQRALLDDIIQASRVTGTRITIQDLPHTEPFSPGWFVDQDQSASFSPGAVVFEPTKAMYRVHYSAPAFDQNIVMAFKGKLAQLKNLERSQKNQIQPLQDVKPSSPSPPLTPPAKRPKISETNEAEDMELDEDASATLELSPEAALLSNFRQCAIERIQLHPTSALRDLAAVAFVSQHLLYQYESSQGSSIALLSAEQDIYFARDLLYSLNQCIARACHSFGLPLPQAVLMSEWRTRMMSDGIPIRSGRMKEVYADVFAVTKDRDNALQILAQICWPLMQQAFWQSSATDPEIDEDKLATLHVACDTVGILRRRLDRQTLEKLVRQQDASVELVRKSLDAFLPGVEGLDVEALAQLLPSEGTSARNVVCVLTLLFAVGILERKTAE